MYFYQPPRKNPAAASLSLLLGLVVIAEMALSFRVADNDRLIQKAEPLVVDTTPVDPTAPVPQAATSAPAVPAPSVAAPIPAAKKSNRTTKTS